MPNLIEQAFNGVKQKVDSFKPTYNAADDALGRAINGSIAAVKKAITGK